MIFHSFEGFNDSVTHSLSVVRPSLENVKHFMQMPQLHHHHQYNHPHHQCNHHHLQHNRHQHQCNSHQHEYNSHQHQCNSHHLGHNLNRLHKICQCLQSMQLNVCLTKLFTFFKTTSICPMVTWCKFKNYKITFIYLHIVL